MKTGNQCTLSGSGDIFDHFLTTGEIKDYGGKSQEPVSFYDESFETASCRLIKFNQTFYKMPYDCRKSRCT